MKFQSFKNWLLERKNENLSYGCLMLYAKVSDWNDKIRIVDKKDVYEKDDDYGYEKEPHITIVYGLHQDEIDNKELYEKIKELIRPVTVKIEKISIFENDEYDVVKFDVPVTDELKEYRKEFMKFPNTQKFPGYHPHMTIAYVKRGEGKKYVQKLDKPFEVTFRQAVYSNPEHKKKYFDLGQPNI